MPTATARLATSREGRDPRGGDSQGWARGEDMVFMPGSSRRRVGRCSMAVCRPTDPPSTPPWHSRWPVRVYLAGDLHHQHVERPLRTGAAHLVSGTPSGMAGSLMETAPEWWWTSGSAVAVPALHLVYGPEIDGRTRSATRPVRRAFRRRVGRPRRVVLGCWGCGGSDGRTHRTRWDGGRNST